MSDCKICPNCGEEAWREEADVGVGIIYGPWGCSCGWSEDDKYNRLTGSGGVQPCGAYIDPQGMVYPKDSPIAIIMRGMKDE